MKHVLLFTYITIRGALPEEASIYTAEMRGNKIALKKIKKKRIQKMGNIYSFSEFYAVHQIQQKNT